MWSTTSLLLVIVACILADDLQEKWKAYKTEYDKVYTEAEDSKRLEIFSDNLKIIETHNALYKTGEASHEKGINQFTDMTQEEFEEFIGCKLDTPSEEEEYTDVYEPPADLEVPDSIDWRQSGAVTPIRWQGNCGACYAFTAAACLESHYFLQTRHLYVLSPQLIIDCTKNSPWGNNGCRGGTVEKSYSYIKVKGIQLEASYPYAGADGNCHANMSARPRIKVKGYSKVPKSEDNLKSVVGTVGPVAVGVDIAEWKDYRSGILVAKKPFEKIGHGVVVVGYGTEHGQKYWLLKNSWTERWGEHGYIRIARDRNNQFGITNQCCYPKL